jgi:hypothetical protein
VILSNKVGQEVIYVYVEHPKPKEPCRWCWLIYPLSGFLVAVILVTVFVLLAKRNGWLCCKRKTGRYECERKQRIPLAPTPDNADMVAVDDPDERDTAYNQLVASHL